MNCRSCGMPMKDAKQHGAGDPKNVYCIYCTDNKGKLKPKAAVKAGMVIFFMKSKKVDKKTATKLATAYMRKMPAWKRKKKAPKKKPKKKPKKRK